MNLIDFIDKKISRLKTAKKSYDKQISVLNDAINGLKTSIDSFIAFDYTDAIDLLEYSDTEKTSVLSKITEIKQIQMVNKKLIEDGYGEIPLTDEQNHFLFSLIRDLMSKIKDYQEKNESIEFSSQTLDRIKLLEDLKKIITNSGKKKIYDIEMLEALFDDTDIEEYGYETLTAMISEFYTLRNFNKSGKMSQAEIDIIVDETFELFQKYLLLNSQSDQSRIDNFRYMIKAFDSEVAKNINLKAAEEILEFFKEKDLIPKFENTALLTIVLYADPSYVKYYYDKYISDKENDPETDLNFTEAASTFWICNEVSRRRKPFMMIGSEHRSSHSRDLFSIGHTITRNEFDENIAYLQQSDNNYIFGDNQVRPDCDLLSSINNSWAVKRNTPLVKMFGYDKEKPFSTTAIGRGNLEENLHLAVELGLLHPPRTQTDLDLEKNIRTNSNFKKHHKGINDSIREYFLRYPSRLTTLSQAEFALLFKMLQNSPNSVDFYNRFFSDSKAGQCGLFFSGREKSSVGVLMATDFIHNKEPQLITGFSEYESVINQFDERQKESLDFSNYYDESILNDPLIAALEEHHKVIDIYYQGENEVSIPNNFVYRFGNVLISRYKVLHNASILKHIYNRLDENMLLTAIVKNSLISEARFNTIKTAIVDLARDISGGRK